MKILITGANGFLGRNLIDRLINIDEKYIIYKYDRESTLEELETYTKDCDFVFNFAAVHRPKDVSEFDKVNHLLFSTILDLLQTNNNTCPVLYTSSIQATNGSEYGDSKLSAEKDLLDYAMRTGAKAIIYRLTNIYGRWATPNHHSVVATFCYNLANDLPITITDENHVMNFYYIDDVIDSFIGQLDNSVLPCEDGIYRLQEEKIYSITLGKLAEYLIYFRDCVKNNVKPYLENEIKRTLYLTYLSYVKK